MNAGLPKALYLSDVWSYTPTSHIAEACPPEAETTYLFNDQSGG